MTSYLLIQMFFLILIVLPTAPALCTHCNQPKVDVHNRRNLHLMAKSFVEKQKWAAMLEAIAGSNSNSSMIKDVKVLGNIICRLSAHKTNQLDVLCTWPVSNEVMLIGTESGLYAMQFSNDVNRQPMLRLPNVDCSVYTIEGRHDINMMLFIVGPDRNVIFCELEAMKQWMSSKNSLQPPNFTAIDSAMSATVLAIERNSDGLYLCIAMTESVVLYKFNHSLKAFCIRKEIPVCQPCCCLSFNDSGAIFGSDKFYMIEFNTCDVKEFLDKTDSTLAFAVFGAVQYESYPIAVFSILQDQVSTGEFLLCFNEFGVFVNNSGKRSRKQNIKWTGLPLMFAYKEPFLYTIHYNAVQVMEIMPRHNHSSAPVGMKTFVNLVGAQFLGPALTQGALYVASVTDEATEILCLKGIPNGVAITNKQQ